MTRFGKHGSNDYRATCIRIIFIGILLISSSGVGAAASATVLDDGSTPAVNGPRLLQSEAGPANTSDSGDGTDLPPPHRNPEEIEDSSDLSQLASVLSGSLNQKLSGSLESLDADDYERARELLGEEYTADLERYSGIATETDTEAQATQYETARSSQQEYVNSVAQYEETQREYQQARANGNDQRARELARELIDAADEINTTSSELVVTYEELDQTTEANFSDEAQRVEARQKRVQQTRQDITETQLVETKLSATADQSTIAFTDPLTISGELRTATGQPIERQQIQLVVDKQSYTVDLGSDGSFQQRLRPSDIWQAGQIEIEYDPDPQSVYLGATTALPVTVEPTETSITIDTLSQQASFDEPARVEGTVTTAGTNTPVPTAPVTFRIDGERAETVQTTTDGEFAIVGDVSPRVASGSVDADIGLESSALALIPSQTERTIQIKETETNLTVNATPASPGEMTVAGELRSVSGRDVPAMPVTIQIDNTTVGTVETDQVGEFNETFTLPDTTNASGAVQVKAQFTGTDSNLNSANATATVAVNIFDTTGFDNPTGVLLLLSVISLVVAIAGWWLWRESPTDEQTTPSEATMRDTRGTAAEKPDNEFLLQAADEALAEGSSKSAAKLAYAAVRRHLGAEVAAGASATHWEWYQACTAAGVDRLSELRTLIEDFEQVTFTPDDERTPEAANRVVAMARKIVNAD